MVDNPSNESLWNIVHQPLASDVDTRLRELTQQSKARDLSVSEQAELDSLIHYYNLWVLERSQAMAALQARGVDVLAQLRKEEQERGEG